MIKIIYSAQIVLTLLGLIFFNNSALAMKRACEEEEYLPEKRMRLVLLVNNSTDEIFLPGDIWQEIILLTPIEDIISLIMVSKTTHMAVLDLFRYSGEFNISEVGYNEELKAQLVLDYRADNNIYELSGTNDEICNNTKFYSALVCSFTIDYVDKECLRFLFSDIKRAKILNSLTIKQASDIDDDEVAYLRARKITLGAPCISSVGLITLAMNNLDLEFLDISGASNISPADFTKLPLMPELETIYFKVSNMKEPLLASYFTRKKFPKLTKIVVFGAVSDEEISKFKDIEIITERPKAFRRLTDNLLFQ